MLRESVEDRLREERTEEGSLLPDYGGYCFAGVPHTVASLLGADTGRTLPDDVFEGLDTDVRQVLVVLIDGFGLNHWKRDEAEHEFLARMTEHGTVTPLTSVYPSETAAAITTVHTGRLPAEHGVVGWNVYEPDVDVSFEALPFATKDGERPPGLVHDDVFEGGVIYPTLCEAGIDCRHVVPFPETYEGATAHTYESDDAIEPRLAEALTAEDGSAYVFAYLPHVDHAAHEAGTESADYADALATVCEQVDAALADVSDDVAEETLVVVTADHGHVDTDPARNVDLGSIEGVESGLKRHADGSPVRFAGSPRNVHLHLAEDAVDAVHETLTSELDARVFRREEVLDRGLFGDVEPSETFERRLGDLVLSHRDLSVWWADEEPDELDLIGMHGGLNPDEMLVPFATAKLSTLRKGAD